MSSSTICCSIFRSIASTLDARSPGRARPGGRGRGQARGDVSRRYRQSDRAARGAAHGAAQSLGAPMFVDGRDVMPDVVAERAQGAGLRRGGARGRRPRRDRPAVHRRRQYRHRRLRPRAGDGDAGACRPIAPMQLRAHFVSNVDGADIARHAARPRPRADAVHRLLEDLHDPGDDDQRRDRARTGSRRARRGGGRRPFRRGLDQARQGRRIRHRRRSAYSASGTGSAAAIPSGRRSGCRCRSRSGRSNSRSSCAAAHDVDQHFRDGAARAATSRC